MLLSVKVHAGSFRVSVIHRSLTWSTAALTCVCDHSYACVYTAFLSLGLFNILSSPEVGVDVAQWLVERSEFKSEEPGFAPLVEQGEGQFLFCPSESTLFLNLNFILSY